MFSLTKISLAFAFSAALLAAPAKASTVSIEDFHGGATRCVGTWSASTFDACATPERAGHAGGTMIAQFNLSGPKAGKARFSSNAGSMMSSYFSLMLNGKGRTGSWTYDPTGCDACFEVTSFVIRSKGVSRWYYADADTGLLSGDWSTFGNKALRRIAFYGRAPGAEPEAVPPTPVQLPAVIPVPATGLLLVGGLALLAATGRRRRA